MMQAEAATIGVRRMRRQVKWIVAISAFVGVSGAVVYWLWQPSYPINRETYDKFFADHKDLEKITRQDVVQVFGPAHEVETRNGAEVLRWNSDEVQLVFEFCDGKFYSAIPDVPRKDDSFLGSIRSWFKPKPKTAPPVLPGSK